MSGKSYTEQELQAEIERVYDAHGVVLEKIESDIQTIAEGNQMLSERTDRGFAEIKKAIQGLDGRLTKLESIVFKLEDKASALEKNTGEIKSELKEIRKELKNTVNKEEFEQIKKRISILEEKVKV